MTRVMFKLLIVGYKLTIQKSLLVYLYIQALFQKVPSKKGIVFHYLLALKEEIELKPTILLRTYYMRR